MIYRSPIPQYPSRLKGEGRNWYYLNRSVDHSDRPGGRSPDLLRGRQGVYFLMKKGKRIRSKDLSLRVDL